MRSLSEIANATPPDYLSFGPKDPASVASQMINKARQLYPRNIDTAPLGAAVEPGYTFLYVGPGAGQIIQHLLEQEQSANGVETSKRGIVSGPKDVWNYDRWQLPWELHFGNREIDVTLVNRYLQKLLLPDEWTATVKEIKRISKYSSLI